LPRGEVEELISYLILSLQVENFVSLNFRIETPTKSRSRYHDSYRDRKRQKRKITRTDKDTTQTASHQPE
jgi:hypothetical protein